MADLYDTIIVGGGISGLAALHAARKRGENVVLLERSERPGGTIRTVVPPWGGVVELGPNTLRGGDGVLAEFIDEIGLRDNVVESSPTARDRFILRDGHPVEVPTGPRSAIETPLFSLKGKLRVLSEPFRRRSGSNREESVADFVRRRFGEEVLDWAVDPFVSGIYAGDPEQLSVQEIFPILPQLEKEAGSVLRGMMQRRKGSKARGRGEHKTRKRPYSFVGGLRRLPDRIAELYPDSILFGREVLEIAESSHGWLVKLHDDTLKTKRLILATEAHTTARLLTELDPEVSSILQSVSSSPVAVLPLLYNWSAFPTGPPSGFGMLIPSKEDRATLGVIYSSSIYPERVPEGKVLLTLFVGGVKNQALLEKPDPDLLAIAIGEIEEIYRLTEKPVDHLLHRWNPGIPQHNVGYRKIVLALDALEERHAGLRLIGSYRGGVSVPDCIESGLGAL